MKEAEGSLDRLLRAAAATANELPNEMPNEMPFGFDTRVLARWRASEKNDFRDLRRLLHRVVLLSLAVIALASAATYRELGQGAESAEPFLDQDAIADSAISNAFQL